MKKGFSRRILSVLLVIAMLVAWAVPASAEDTEDISFTQVDNSAVSAEIPGKEAVDKETNEKTYAADEEVRVSIMLEKASALEAGYNFSYFMQNWAALAYCAELEEIQEMVMANIEKLLGEELDVVWNMTMVANLISAYVEYGQIEEILNVPGVVDVVVETQYYPAVTSTGDANPNMATSGLQIGTAPAWAAGYTGAGSRIAIIDSGIDLQHLSFDAGAFEYSLKKNAEKAGLSYEEYLETIDLLDVAEIAAVADMLHVSIDPASSYLNAKLPFGYNYVDENYNVTHLYDNGSEHGSHVAGIAAANAYVPTADGYASALETVYVQGVAPDAQLIPMKVFGVSGGAYDSDYMVAIEDAIVLGADSINLSLGSVAPGNSTVAPEFREIMENLQNCGVVVTMSAGNDGHWAEQAANAGFLYNDDVSMHTVGKPGSYTNSLAVASVNNSGMTALYISVGETLMFYTESLFDQNGVPYGNTPLVTLAGEQEYVFIDGIGSPEDWAAVGDALVGKVAICSRGTTSFFEKANAAVEAGAIATLIYNNEPGIIGLNLTGYLYDAPCVSLTQAEGAILKAAATAVTDEEGNPLYYIGKLTVSDSAGSAQSGEAYYTMSSFSSWGVPGSLELKPEITAPGGNIYSVGGAYMGGISDHVTYENMSGTSMAAPQVAGMAALIAQYIRETGLDVKTGRDARFLAQSLLMSTAEPIIDGNSGYYYPVLQQGAGLANVGNVISADSYIAMAYDATKSYADGKVKVELGDDPDRNGVYTFSFTINNITDSEKVYSLDSDFFIQYPTADGNNNLYMYTETAGIAPNVIWTVDGQTVEPDSNMKYLDFNGDGKVSYEDGQALLDYATGVRTELYNAELADLNGDGKIGSYDAYMFLTMPIEGGVKVPANGNVTVTATVALTGNDMAIMDYYYPEGTYLQGYVYAESVSTAEGVEGTCHSIPVLGFFGNWTDPSMYDVGTYLEYLYGEETRMPYLGDPTANTFTVVYANDPTSEYYFGGNPMVTDPVYCPERNAINGENGDVIGTIYFTAIRNAADGLVTVSNLTSEQLLIAESIGEITTAFFNVNTNSWANTSNGLGLGFSPAMLGEYAAEGDVLEVGLTLAPEYYLDAEGNIDWNALGHGATFSMPMVIDNTAPCLLGGYINYCEDTLQLYVKDNQYIAAVALFDEFGQYLYTFEGAQMEALPGDLCSYALDLSEVNGAKFLLQVYDYAMNTTTYEIKWTIGETTDTVEGIELSASSAVLAPGNTTQLFATVIPVNATDRGVVWTSSDDAVATVDANGLVTAVADGVCIVTATSSLDPSFSAECVVSVVTIDATISGVVQDVNGTPMLYTWNLAEDATWTAGPEIGTYIASATINELTGDPIYVHNPQDSAMYIVDPATGETSLISGPCGFGIALDDLAYAMYNSYVSGVDKLFGIYGSYLLGPSTPDGNTFTSGWQLGSYLANYTGASSFVALAYVGMNSDGEDVFCALDNAGAIWTLYYNGTSSIGLGIASTDLVFPYNTSYDNYYCSMTGGTDGNLYLSAFNGSTNVVYCLVYNEATESYNALRVGDFGADVWPATITSALGNESEDAGEAGEGAAATVIPDVDVIANVESVEIVPVVKESEEIIEGGLNSLVTVSDNAAAVLEGKDEMTVTLTVTAKDAEGVDITSTNGVVTVTYDAEKLELVGTLVNGEMKSINAAEGVVTFGYVETEGIAAEDAVATLVFNIKKHADTEVSLDHAEANDAFPGYQEVLEVVHEHYEEVVGAVEATCTTEGYTGDTICQLCGEVLVQGEVIPVTHKFGEWEVVKEATETEDGEEIRKCELCDYTETRVIPAYGLPVTPSTGDNFNVALFGFLALASAAALAVVSVLTFRKKYN